LGFSRYVRSVTLLVRRESLSQSMSQYLIEQIGATPNIKVRLRCEVAEVHGEERLEAITVLDCSTQQKETVPTHALFIFIGGLTHTEYLKGVVKTDDHGFILTGPHLEKLGGDHHPPPLGWPLERDPFWLECSVPGIFAAVSVRHGSAKRVAVCVGCGSSMTHIKDSSVDDRPNAPFGGEKNSGIGRFGGEWIIQGFTTDH